MFATTSRSRAETDQTIDRLDHCTTAHHNDKPESYLAQPNPTSKSLSSTEGNQTDTKSHPQNPGGCYDYADDHPWFARILGGEACLWGEGKNASNIHLAAWPGWVRVGEVVVVVVVTVWVVVVSVGIVVVVVARSAK